MRKYVTAVLFGCFLSWVCRDLSGQLPNQEAAPGITHYISLMTVSTSFQQPAAVAAAPTGDVYVADAGHNQIRVIRVDGRVEVVAGSGSAGLRDGIGLTAEFQHPRCLAFDIARSVLYVADTGNHVIREVALDGTVRTLAGIGRPGSDDGPGGRAAFRFPSGLAIDRVSHVLYVADTGNSTIRSVTPAGVVSTVATGFKQPEGLAVSSDGFLYVADTLNHVIRRLTGEGSVVVAGTGQPGFQDGSATAAQFHEPVSITATDSGALIVADRLNHRLRLIDIANRWVQTIAGIGQPSFLDGEPLNAGLHGPSGLTASGAVWIADETNDAIRMLVPELTVASVQPSRGPLDGVAVRIFGTGFVPGRTSVTFGASRIGNVEVVSATELRVMAPAADEGVVDITVSTIGGSATLSGEFAYVAPPTVTSISPAKGPVAGGSRVTIAGSKFVMDEVSVTFGRNTAVIAAVDSSTMTVIVPASNAAGRVDVQVQTPGGTASLAGAYQYFAPPQITSFFPDQGSVGTGVTLTGANFDIDSSGNAVTLNDVPASIAEARPDRLVVIVPPGASTGFWSVTTAGGTAASGMQFTVPKYVRIELSPATLSMQVGERLQLSASGVSAAGGTEDVTTKVSWTVADETIASVNIDGLLSAHSPGSSRIAARLGELSGFAEISVRPAGPALPPDPSLTASPTNDSLPTSFADSIAFLYSGATPIQVGVEPGAIATNRACVIRGRVVGVDDTPLTGVVVSVHGDATVGTTISRVDGAFDIVANGGGDVTLEFNKTGYVRTHRRILTRWNDFSVFDADIRMTKYDASATELELSGLSVPAVARGSVVVDEDGTRRATMIFRPGTTAEMVFTNGLQQSLDRIHVRATELTIGRVGAMPADLPVETAYTYCAELSVDEAVAAGAERVEFSQPVSIYVENFLHFPAGNAVPVGYYDRAKGDWVAMDDGRVIQIVGVANGRADIDINGDGSADDVTVIGISDEERATLATLYSSGESLWRVAVRHFSPYDMNWSWTIPADAEYPSLPEAAVNDAVPGQCCQTGSIIESESQTLGERVPIQGTPFTLQYRSRSAPGNLAQRKLTIQMSRAALPASVKRIDISLSIAGQQVRSSFSPGANLSTSFVWDGKDAYGRLQYTSRPMRVQIGYVYDGKFLQPAGSGRSFGSAGGQALSVFARRDVTLSQSYVVTLAGQRPSQGLGGWALDVLHSYDADRHDLRLGNGTDVHLEAQARSAKQMPITLTSVRFITTGSDGSVYAAAWQCGPILRREPNGVVRNLGGGGSATPVDGAAASTARLCAGDMAVAANGNLVVLDRSTQKIFSIAAGKLTLLASVPSTSSNYSLAASPHGPVYFTHQNNLYRIDAGSSVSLAAAATGDMLYKTVRAGRDGNLYLATLGTGTQSKLLTIRRWSGTGPNEAVLVLNLDRFPTTRTLEGFTVDSHGRLYYHTDDDELIHVVETDGSKHDYVSARPFIELNGFEANAEDRLTFVDNVSGGRGVYVDDVPIILRTNGGDGWVAALPPGQEAFVFAADGRHIETREPATGLLKFSFIYDAAGYPIQIIDELGRTTTIERDADNRPVAFVAPGGLRTEVSLDAHDRLSRIVAPGGVSDSYFYDENGLLRQHLDPAGNASTYAYDDEGRLVHAANASGRTKDLSRATTASPSETNVTLTTSEGRVWKYDVVRQSDDFYSRVLTLPSGGKLTSSHSPFLTTATLPDGTTIRIDRKPDPQWGGMSPFTSASSITLPSGRKLTFTRTLAMTMTNPGDPMSVASVTETAGVTGSMFASTFTRADRKVRTISPAGRVVDTFLDSHGRPIEIRAPGAPPLLMAYDDRGRVATMTQGGRQMTIEWDAFDRPMGYVDPLGRTLTFTRDSAGRITGQALPGDRAIAFQYDSQGNVVTIQAPSGAGHTFVYGPTGELTRDASPGPQVTRYEYDKDGELAHVIRPDQTSIDFTYDAAGRVISIAAPDTLYGYGYDSAGTLRTIDAPGSHISKTMDGFLPLSVSWSGTVSSSMAFGWDANLRLGSDVADGIGISYAYDADGLLVRAGALTLTRDAASGTLSGSTLGSITDSMTFDLFGDVATYQVAAGGSPVLTLAYQRDASGRIVSINDEGFEYDAAGRLARVTRANATVAEYAYDANGNRTTYRYSGGSLNAAYDMADHLVQYGDASYSYNAAGALAAKTVNGVTTRYEYDSFGNLRRVTSPSQVIEYVIDGENRRIAKKLNAVVTNVWTYADRLRIAAERDSSGAVTRFVFGSRPNVPDYMIRNGVAYRFVVDHRGSPLLLINSGTGEIAQALTYDAFGNVLSDSNPGFQPFGFAGGLYDRDTGLLRFGARDYDAHTGRWTDRDPIGFGGGSMNLYTYAFNDPVNSIDPNGMLSIPLAGWVDLGETAGSAALNQWADHITDPNTTGVDLVGSYIGGFFAALWTPCTSDRTFLTLSAAYAVNTYVARPFYQYYPANNAAYNSRYLTRGPGWKPPYDIGTDAVENLALPRYNPATAVRQVPSRWNEFVGGPHRVLPNFGQPGGGIEYVVGGWPR